MKDRTRLRMALTLGIALTVASLGVIGCSTASGASSGDLSATPKTGVEKIAADRCASCHSAARALRWRASSKSEAKRLIDSMVKRGASPSESDKAALIDYFVK